MRPIFVDNRDGNTMARAINEHLKYLRESGDKSEELCISSAYFNPQGLKLISNEIDLCGHIRLLLGAEPTPEAYISHRTPYDPHEPKFTKNRLTKSLHKIQSGMINERNRIPFTLNGSDSIKKLLDFLNSGHIEVRRYEKGFLHAKAFIFRGTDNGMIIGSSNLTRAGLKSNLELNLGHYDDPLISKVENWFDELWEQSVSFDLAAIYQELLAQYHPYLIYLKVLWMLYSKELAEEELETGHIPVTTFQKHGIWRAKHILKKYGGVLISDGVGLGKTYTAGEIIREYRDKRQRVLLICPASLRDTSWKKFLNDFQLLVDCVSYEQLANDSQLDGEKHHLNSSIEDYALVVIDEAHNYRNPDAPNRAGILRKLLSGKRRDLLLLSATPVNNSLWDLYHLLSFFLKQDAVLSDLGILSIRERFNEAMRLDPYSLSPDHLYPIIDATTVKRTRRFIKKYYNNDQIKDPDGEVRPIHFPTPKALSISYNLDTILPDFFERLEEILCPEVGSSLLTLAKYQPDKYLLEIVEDLNETTFVGLLRSGLLKRFESSVHSFGLTVGRMIRQHEVFLEALEHGKVINKDYYKENLAIESGCDIDELLNLSENSVDASIYNAEELKSDVEGDLVILNEMHDKTINIKDYQDPKLLALVESLVSIINKARSEAVDDEDEQQKRKVLVFSYYEDSVDWIENYLNRVLNEDDRLKSYRKRIASVSGAQSRNHITRNDVVNGFAPVSTGALSPNDIDLYDLIICTDVLAEGMNLQQCRNIINYDLPWNPMRLVQRHGRVDRIGSNHNEIFLHTFFPDSELDAILRLEERVRSKLAQAAASVGVEVAPIEEGAMRDVSFSETHEEITRLFEGDASIYEQGGTMSTAQSGEEYRQELRKEIELFDDRIDKLPWRIGAGLKRGNKSGHFFCASIGNRIYLRFVPLTSDEAIVDEIGVCLRMIECDEEELEIEYTGDLLYSSWERARKNIFDSWTFETDPANLEPKIRKLNRDVAAFIRTNSPTDLDQDILGEILDSIESPWPRRDENQLKITWTNEYGSNQEKVDALINKIDDIGIEPSKPPEKLPPIKIDEILLVCWMWIEAE